MPISSVFCGDRLWLGSDRQVAGFTLNQWVGKLPSHCEMPVSDAYVV
ncbi:MAG: hypothetical protein F6K10_34315 [Moorea sp. SIO2B7]|nr:hypothetical protein [Moorena sp. SIO2B7]